MGQARYVVTCLQVAGNHAALGLVPADNAANDVDQQFVLSVMDSRMPGGAGDLFAFIQVPANTCAGFVFTANFPLTHGNIVVHDVVAP